MRTSRCAIVVVISILAVTGTVTYAAQQTSGVVEQGPSGTRIASGIVRITADPGLLPLNADTVESLIHSSGVAGKAARDVLGLRADIAVDLYEGIEIEWLSGVMQGTNAPPSRSRPARPGRYGAERMMEGYGAPSAGLYGLGPGEAREERDEPEGSDIEGGRDLWPGLGRRDERSARRTRSDPMLMMSQGTYTGDGLGSGMMGHTGMGGMYAMPPSPPEAVALQQTATLKLSVWLPDEVNPVAAEFLSGLVENLRTTLTDAHKKYTEDLDSLLHAAQAQREDAYTQLERKGGTPSPERVMVEEQLATYVDLSELSPETSLSEAIDVLRDSVDPPLQIVVMSRDLLENADIEPTTTPIQMDGLSNVRLRTALDVLLRAVSNPLVAELCYKIEGNVLTIGTSDVIRPTPLSVALPYDESDIQALAAQRRDLSRQIQSVEMELATMEAREKAITGQIARAQLGIEAELADDKVVQELEQLIELNKAHLANVERTVKAGRAPASDLIQARENLAKARIELAQRRDERSRILGDQVRQFNIELSLMAVERAEKEAQRDLLRQQKDQVQREWTEASVFDPEAARIRTTRDMIDRIDHQIAALQTRLANLQPPTVAMIGAD